MLSPRGSSFLLSSQNGSGSTSRTVRGNSPPSVFSGEGFTNRLQRRGESLEAAQPAAGRAAHTLAREKSKDILKSLDALLPGQPKPAHAESLPLVLSAIEVANSFLKDGYRPEAYSILGKLDQLEAVSELLQPANINTSSLAKALYDLSTQPYCDDVASQHINSIFKKADAYYQKDYKPKAGNGPSD